MRQTETFAAFQPEGAFRVGQSALPDWNADAEDAAARDLLAAAQAAGLGVIDLLAAGHPLDRTLDRRMVTGTALVMEQEASGDNPVAGMGGFNFTAGPAAGLVQLDALDQFSDTGSGSNSGSAKPDKPPGGNLGAPLGVPGSLGPTA
jgi:hypothetical protein